MSEVGGDECGDVQPGDEDLPLAANVEPEEYAPIERVVEGGHPPLMHATWMSLLRDRFGPDPRDWAFVCPGCGDVATGKDLEEALARNPRQHSERGGGERPVTFGDLLGQECIGRTLGALDGTNDPYEGRGCTWAAYGLIPGPIGVHMPNGAEIRVFKAAPVEAVQLRTSLDETVET
jgi:hypothetical protein